MPPYCGKSRPRRSKESSQDQLANHSKCHPSPLQLSRILTDLSPFVSGTPQPSFHQTFISDRNARWSDIGTPALAHNSEAAARQHQLNCGPPHDHSSVWGLRLGHSQPHRTARWLFSISVTLDGSNFYAPWAWMSCARREVSLSIATLEKVGASSLATQTSTVRHHPRRRASANPHHRQDAAGCAVCGGE